MGAWTLFQQGRHLGYPQDWLSYVLRPLGLEGLFGTSRFFSRSQRGLSRRKGFTVIELILTTALIGILASIARPKFQDAVDRSRMTRAVGDINSISIDLNNYRLEEGTLPLYLSEVGLGDLVDPWGNPYRYVAIRGYSVYTERLRKDRFLVPINSDFDLYSMGPDGESTAGLTVGISMDDIIRASDGGYVGVAELF